MLKQKYESSVLVLDIRNFTSNLIYFEQENNNAFIIFIEKIWRTGFALTKIISGDNSFYNNSTGDGFISIFFGKDHYKNAYLLGIKLYFFLEEICKTFSKEYNRKVSFGIGIESGIVKKITNAKNENINHTYIGNVINKAARIEAETKSHARAFLLIGNKLNNILVKELFNEDYHQLMKSVKDNPNDTDQINKTIDKMNRLNQYLMLSYIFEHNLKGVDSPVPIFRLSPTLAHFKKQLYNELINKLTDKETIEKINIFLRKE